MGEKCPTRYVRERRTLPVLVGAKHAVSPPVRAASPGPPGRDGRRAAGLRGTNGASPLRRHGKATRPRDCVAVGLKPALPARGVNSATSAGDSDQHRSAPEARSGTARRAPPVQSRTAFVRLPRIALARTLRVLLPATARCSMPLDGEGVDAQSPKSLTTHVAAECRAGHRPAPTNTSAAVADPPYALRESRMAVASPRCEPPSRLDLRTTPVAAAFRLRPGFGRRMTGRSQTCSDERLGDRGLPRSTSGGTVELQLRYRRTPAMRRPSTFCDGG